MARFMYQARDGRGELASGAVMAATLEEAGRLLRGEGKFIVKLAPVNDADLNVEAQASDPGKHRVRRADVIFFAQQMAVMIETGVPISEALDCVVEQTTSPAFAAVLRDVATQVQAGCELSAALRKYPKVFPSVMTSLIRASEVSGTMGPMLTRIAQYLAKEQLTAKQVRGALMYPLFMLLMAVGVTMFLLTVVLPRFAKIYESRQATLPAPTRLLLALSNGMIDYWWAWIPATVALAVGATLFLRTPYGHRSADWLKLHVPVFKNLFTQLYVTRACRTMGTMISAGVSVLDMIAIVKQVTNNVFYEDLWDQVDERLRQGAQLSDPLFASPLLPRSVVQMIRSGEKSGRLGPTMTRVAEFTEQEFDTAVKTATQFIEPLMVSLMGAIVGFVAIALLMPIFSISRVVSNG